jgi:dTDP-4-dehydrorhamnose 3,5-epimerase-like enzyme
VLIARYHADCASFSLPVRGDKRGELIALEAHREVPFAIERVYFIYGTNPGVVRGCHAHRRLHQFAVCVQGSCTMLLDDGRDRTRLVMDRPSLGLHIGPMIWHEMSDFSPHCVLMVLADAIYDEDDYIRDYDAFRGALAGQDR